MKDVLGQIAALRRPPLLARAARHGAPGYRRERHLAACLAPRGPSGGWPGAGVSRALPEPAALPAHGPALMALMEAEAAEEAARLRKAPHYAPARHVELLIALLGEARLLAEAREAAREGAGAAPAEACGDRAPRPAVVVT